MRLMASCNQVARACWPSGATCFKDGRGDDCGSVFRKILALGDGGGFAHQTSGLHTERGGNLNVDELVGVLGILHVHYRAVFGVDGRVVHEDFDVCTKAGSSRNVRNFVSQRVVPCREGVPVWARRCVFAFLVQGSSALGSVTFPVFASAPLVTIGSA